MEMNRTSWLILAIATFFLGLITFYFYLANPFPPPPVATSPTINDSEISEPNTPSGWSEINRGEISVKTPFTNIGSYKGKILIQMWGKASPDSTQPPFSPLGWKGRQAPSTFILPGGALFGSVLKASDKISPVGIYNDFNFPVATPVSLGANEEQGENDKWYQDNRGSWNYKVSVPK